MLKLRGTGLAEPMTGLRVDDPGHHVTDLHLGAGYAAAVASRHDAPVRLLRREHAG